MRVEAIAIRLETIAIRLDELLTRGQRTIFRQWTSGIGTDEEQSYGSKGHRYERSKDATNGAPGRTTRSK